MLIKPFLKVIKDVLVDKPKRLRQEAKIKAFQEKEGFTRKDVSVIMIPYRKNVQRLEGIITSAILSEVTAYKPKFLLLTKNISITVSQEFLCVVLYNRDTDKVINILDKANIKDTDVQSGITFYSDLEEFCDGDSVPKSMILV